MILDDIQEAYFKHAYDAAIGVELKISFETYKKMLLEDERLIKVGCFDHGNLPPMFGRPVTIVYDFNKDWAWVVAAK